MPIPTPEKDEKEDDYISRCMGDEVMLKDYPDQKQRAAVCYSKHKEHMKQSASYQDVFFTSTGNAKSIEFTEIKQGVQGIVTGSELIGYRFDMSDQDTKWTMQSISDFINSKPEKRFSTVLSGEITEMVTQSYLPEETMSKLSAVDPSPFFVPLRITYGIGSNKQSFDKAFFEKAGHKFEGTSFLYNHSDMGEFGKAIPIGSIVKFAGADESGASFIAYVSAAEGTLRQKIKESQALGNLGFVRKVSIEGIPSESDYTVERKTGIKHFHDLAMPTGIAIVNVEGLRGSAITH